MSSIVQIQLRTFFCYRTQPMPRIYWAKNIFCSDQTLGHAPKHTRLLIVITCVCAAVHIYAVPQVLKQTPQHEFAARGILKQSFSASALLNYNISKQMVCLFARVWLSTFPVHFHLLHLQKNISNESGNGGKIWWYTICKPSQNAFSVGHRIPWNNSNFIFLCSRASTVAFTSTIEQIFAQFVHAGMLCSFAIKNSKNKTSQQNNSYKRFCLT